MATIRVKIPQHMDDHGSICTEAEYGYVYSHNVESTLKEIAATIRERVKQNVNAVIIITEES